MNITILDVTLREGGFRNNWNFTLGNAEQIVSGVTAAGIDFVEIGYRNVPPGYCSKDVGLTGKTSDDYVKAIRQAAPTAKLAVMYSASTVTEADLVTLEKLGVAMVRCDIPVNQAAKALPLIKKARDLGMISVANITVNTDYADEDLVNDCNQVIDNGSSVVYLADSNGSMTPESVRARFELVMSSRVQTTSWASTTTTTWASPWRMPSQP